MSTSHASTTHENLFMPDSIRVYSGTYVNLKNPTADMISVKDIKHSLSRIPRWGGHTKYPYTVLDHSVWCHNRTMEVYKNPDLAVKVFMHDFHEAYIGDIPSPIGVQLQGVDQLKNRIQKAIHDHFGIEMFETDHQIIRAIDLEALYYEWENVKLKWTPHDMKYSDFMFDTIMKGHYERQKTLAGMGAFAN